MRWREPAGDFLRVESAMLLTAAMMTTVGVFLLVVLPGFTKVFGLGFVGWAAMTSWYAAKMSRRPRTKSETGDEDS